VVKALPFKAYVHKNLHNSRYKAISQLINGYLLASLSILTEKQFLYYIKLNNCHLYKDRDYKRILYISGMALHLSKYENIPPMELASAIASHFSATSGKDFTVHIIPPGWLHLELTHPALAAWLQGLVEGGVGGDEEDKGDKGDKEEADFFVQMSVLTHPFMKNLHL